jgi:hypothetical protein
MAGIHTGPLVDYGAGQLARAVTFVSGAGGIHTGPLVDLGSGRYARAVRTVSGSGGTWSGPLVQASGTLARAVMPVSIGGGVHTGPLVDLGAGRYALAVVDVPSPGPGQSARAVVQYDSTGVEVVTVDYVARWGVVEHWALNEASGVGLASISAANNLTDTNTVTSNPGKVYALARQFTAANSEYFSHTDAAQFRIGAVDCWWAGWVWFDTIPGIMVLLAKDNTTASREYMIFQTGNRLKFDSGSGGTLGTGVTANTFGAVTTGQWYFWMAYHQNGVGLALSVNGGPFDTAALPGGIFSGTAPLEIGRYAGGSLYLDGRQGPVTFGKSPPGGIAALATEIRDRLWNGGAGRPYPWS